jgi:uncharacterized membrane protein HdeD (DUF308 family)
MNSFWASFFGHFQSCGRNAAWFLGALGGLFVFLVLSALAIENGHGESVAAAMIVAAVFGLGFVCAAVRRAWLDRRHRLKFPKLSSDERTKARSRLVKPRAPVKLPPQPPPWIEA